MKLENPIYIYSLSDPKDNIVRYIGKTNNIKKRYKGHLRNKQCETHNSKWVKKLKANNEKPIIEIIDIIPKQEWIFWEQYWISQFIAWGFKLNNLTGGGDGMSEATAELKEKMSNIGKGRVFTEEHKKRISEANKGKETSLQHRINIGKKSRGRVFTKERNDKIRVANTGRVQSKESIEKRVLKMKGIFKHSDETKEKMRIKRLGTKASEETKQKMSITRTNKKHSEETKRKMAESYRKRTNKNKENEN
jgi:hypothetical protein